MISNEVLLRRIKILNFPRATVYICSRTSHLSLQIVMINGNTKTLKAALKKFLYTNSFYTLDEYSDQS
jgi:hypothetical protein